MPNKENDNNTSASSPRGLGPFDTGQLHQNKRFLAVGLWCPKRPEARLGRTDSDHGVPPIRVELSDDIRRVAMSSSLH